MHSSKYRIRKALEAFPSVQLRRIIDPRGDTGCFLITTYKDRETAGRVNQALRAEGIVTHPQGVSNVLMTEWGLHLYHNIPSLVNKTSVDGRGFPWKLAENAGLERSYAKGACPVSDSLFERSIILAIPSCLSERTKTTSSKPLKKFSTVCRWCRDNGLNGKPDERNFNPLCGNHAARGGAA
jgi:hypothetical protein